MSAPKFNVQEVSAWLRELREESGIPGLWLSINQGENPAHAWYWNHEKSIDETVSAQTLEEAISTLKSKLTPTSLARQKRERAQVLINEAAQIEAEDAL